MVLGGFINSYADAIAILFVSVQFHCSQRNCCCFRDYSVGFILLIATSQPFHITTMASTANPSAATAPPPPSSSSNAETTFRSYNQKQGENYSQYRGKYHQNLYNAVLSYHSSTGGQTDTALDIGCGPGIATRGLAPHFTHVLGLDPSEGMISTARSLGGVTTASEPIRYEVSTAEDLGASLSPDPVKSESIDLLTAATCAHYFDMTAFWKRAADVVKPGGTVALWTTAGVRVHPDVPNAQAIQDAIDEFQEGLRDYMGPGHILCHELYKALPLPWTLEVPVPEFDEQSFVRKEWNTGGPETWQPFKEGEGQGANLKLFELVLGTASPVTRWREQHPESVGTEQDVVKVLVRKIEKLYHEVGIEADKAEMRGALKAVLLMVKKKV
jgi:trans-aconitate 3-methyltransferase